MKKTIEKTTQTPKKDADGRKKNGGARENAGRPAFVPTENERKQVEALSGFGLPFEQIAALLRDGIHIDTLRRHFQAELINGKAKANAQIGKSIFQKAMAGDTTAQIWWSKSQMGWKDTQRVEHSSPDGTMTPKAAIDVSKLSSAAMAEILAAQKNAPR